MKTIVVIAQSATWKRALQTGVYVQSTIDSTLKDVGFIHCSLPDQTIDIANRHFANWELGEIVILLVDASKVASPIKYEAALSGRKGMYPHIYGPLNADAVYAAVPLTKNSDGMFEVPSELLAAQQD